MENDNYQQYTQQDENDYQLKYQAESTSPTNITTGTTGFAPDSSDITEDQDNSAGDSIEIVHQDDYVPKD